MSPTTISSHEAFDADAEYGAKLQGHGSPASMQYLIPSGETAYTDWRWQLGPAGELLQGIQEQAPGSIATDERPFMRCPAAEPDCTAFGSTILHDPRQARLTRMAATFQNYDARIRMLHATADDEGESVNPASEQDFWGLMLSAPPMQKASVVLLANGNLRAIWKGESGKHLGVQFLGSEMAQYVIFTRRPEADTMSRFAGRDTVRAFGEIVNAFDLYSLLDA